MVKLVSDVARSFDSSTTILAGRGGAHKWKRVSRSALRCVVVVEGATPARKVRSGATFSNDPSSNVQREA